MQRGLYAGWCNTDNFKRRLPIFGKAGIVLRRGLDLKSTRLARWNHYFVVFGLNRATAHGNSQFLRHEIVCICFICKTLTLRASVLSSKLQSFQYGISFTTVFLYVLCVWFHYTAAYGKPVGSIRPFLFSCTLSLLIYTANSVKYKDCMKNITVLYTASLYDYCI